MEQRDDLLADEAKAERQTSIMVVRSLQGDPLG